MKREKGCKLGLKGIVFGFLAVFLAFFSVIGVNSQTYAVEPTTGEEMQLIAVEPADKEEKEEDEEKNEDEDKKELTTADNCQDSLGAIGWLVCPTTGKIAEAVDFLYGVIENFLVVNPVVIEDGQPVYEVWKYCRAITNIVFIIFFLVIIYSQLTGVGISNYGIKKALPKLIVVAIMMNLSFLLCSIAVDVSNIVGNGLRGVFTSIQESAVVGMNVNYSNGDLFGALAAGSAVAIGGTVIAFATGAIWMIIPVLLGALVSVVAGLITVAMRQAVIVLLIMIAPLAIVAYMLPNTENLFQKWKKLLIRMLVFYPMFSVLFGASQLAGFAIITSADNWFSLLLGIAVQIFPLFFSVKLMQMSGTFLGSVNDKLRGFAAKPLATNRAWADSHRELTRRKNAALENSKLPSRRLVGFLADRKTQREAVLGRKKSLQESRALAGLSRRNYAANGVPTKKGEEEYEDIARTLEYQREIARNENNMNAGLGMLAAVNMPGNVSKKQKARIDALDNRIVNASDYLNVEKARGEKIEYDNAEGFHRRMNAAIEAHMDIEHGYTVDPETGMRVRSKKYKMHMEPGSAEAATAATRYAKMSEIMEGNVANVQYAAATAARGFDAQKKIVENTYQKYFDLTPPTKDVVYRLAELTKQPDAAEYMNAIIPGLRVLNQRGDTDLVREQMNNVLKGSGGLELGTNASQALASFLMFEVKDNDPWLRRFGKYINLETARAYNGNDRQELKVTYDEYIKGYHDEPDPTPEEPFRVKRMYAKKGMKELMQGTPVDNVERTALANFDASLLEAYTGPNGLDLDEYLRKRDQVQSAIGPQFTSASLKYLSGSEQLSSFVKFLTGYSRNQAKQNGEVMTDEHGEPMYVWETAWGKGGEFGGNPEHAKKAKEYFRKKTMDYLTAQTPSQIYGLRSDYRTPLFEHLADAYELDEMEGWSDEEKADHREYMDKLAEIETRYGDLPLEEARAKREADKKALRKEMETKIAGPEFRHLLDGVGTLNMLYRTRDKGAANGAKSWVRDWLDLENEQMIRAKLRKAGQKGKGGGGSGDADGNKVYGDKERAEFVTRVDDIYNNLGTEREDKFYNESSEYIKSVLGKGSYIAKEYEKYMKHEPDADSEMLKDYIISLLSDADNY